MKSLFKFFLKSLFLLLVAMAFTGFDSDIGPPDDRSAEVVVSDFEFYSDAVIDLHDQYLVLIKTDELILTQSNPINISDEKVNPRNHKQKLNSSNYHPRKVERYYCRI